MAGALKEKKEKKRKKERKEEKRRRRRKREEKKREKEEERGGKGKNRRTEEPRKPKSMGNPSASGRKEGNKKRNWKMKGAETFARFGPFSSQVEIGGGHRPISFVTNDSIGTVG